MLNKTFTMTILTNELHAKAFKSTWMYDSKILKRYSNHIVIENTKTGNTFKKYIETTNYTKEGAFIDSVKKIELKEDWLIKTVEPIALNNLS